MAQEGTTSKTKQVSRVLLEWDIVTTKENGLDPLWIGSAIAIIIAASLYSFITKECLTGVVFILLILTFLWYILSDKQTLKAGVTNDSIIIGGQRYRFDNLRGYWLSTKNSTIYLAPLSRIAPIIALPAGTTPLKSIVRLFPSEFPEIEREGKDTTDKISGVFRR